MTQFIRATVRLGDSTFTVRQFEFFMSGIAGGLTRDRLQSAFRSEFPRGFSNSAFTEGMRLYQQEQSTLELFSQLSSGQRLSDSALPRVLRQYDTAKYSVTGKIPVLNRETGTIRDWDFRFGSDTPLTPEEIRARATDIVSRGLARVRYQSEAGEVEVTGLVLNEFV